jgi:miniconductance mechanosensitive channel
MIESIQRWLIERGLSEPRALLVMSIGLLAGLFAVAFLANHLAKSYFLRIARRIAERSETKWDDALIHRNVFTRLSHLVPALIVYLGAPWALLGFPTAIDWTQRLAMIYMVFVGVFTLDAFLTASTDVYRMYPISKRLPIKTFVDAAKVALYFIGGILILSLLLQRSPLGFLTGLGALTAVLLLVFKDTILNFVAGIQLNANSMVRVGDWIEVPRFGADGDVIDMSLTTVKVQNFDKTISTVPPYALVTDTFRNWRGMSESGGRRIKRSLSIDMTSVKFCDREMLDRFKRIRHIDEHITRKIEELDAYNREREIKEDDLLNDRRLTNLGTFRAYIEAYLRSHPKTHKSMTFLVRQLAPTDRGLPLEIYVFSNDQVWPNYEAIQADIFDHLIAMAPLFDLRVFQMPTGSDMRSLMSTDPPRLDAQGGSGRSGTSLS